MAKVGIESGVKDIVQGIKNNEVKTVSGYRQY